MAEKQVMIKNRIIGEGRPLVCVPIMERDRVGILREMEYLGQSRADVIEWRGDAFADFADYDIMRQMFRDMAPLLGDKLLLYTFRSKKQGGEASADEKTLTALHDLAMESGCVDLIDLEYFEEEHPAQKIHRLKEGGVRVIASHHDFEGTPEPEVMRMLLDKMCVGGADIVKLAVMPQILPDVLNLLMVTAEFREMNPNTPVITMSMGKLGGISRLCGETFGSCMTFGAHKKPSAPGQYEMNRLLDILDAIHESNILM